MKRGSRGVPLELTGRTFGSWTVLEKVPVSPYRKSRGDHNVYWICRCACGYVKDVRGTGLTTGGTSKCRSCGAREVQARTKARRNAAAQAE